MRFKLVQKKNPQKREEVKFYANPVNVGHKSLDDIARDIAGRSSLTRGDVSNVLYNFIDCLPHYLRDGFSIQLGNFGSMRVTLSSKGAETEKAFKTETIRPRVVFTPGTELKRELAANSYESLRKKEEEEKSLTPAPSPNVKTPASLPDEERRSLTPTPSPNGEGSEDHTGPQAG